MVEIREDFFLVIEFGLVCALVVVLFNYSSWYGVDEARMLFLHLLFITKLKVCFADNTEAALVDRIPLNLLVSFHLNLWVNVGRLNSGVLKKRGLQNMGKVFFFLFTECVTSRGLDLHFYKTKMR